MAARAATCEAALLKAASEQHEALGEGALEPEGWEEAGGPQCLGLGKCGWPAHIYGVCRASRLCGQLAVGVMARRVGVPERISVLGSLHCAARRALGRKPRAEGLTELGSSATAASNAVACLETPILEFEFRLIRVLRSIDVQ